MRLLSFSLLAACGGNDSEEKRTNHPSVNDELRLSAILSDELGEGNKEEIKARHAHLMEEHKRLVESACGAEKNCSNCQCISDRWALFLNKKIDLKTYENSVSWGSIPVFDEKGEHIVAHALCQVVDCL